MPDPQPNRDLITEILEMTVSIERVVFKTDGFPKAKLFQSAKAAVPRGVTPEAISAVLQQFVRVEMDKFENGPRAPQVPASAPLIDQSQNYPEVEKAIRKAQEAPPPSSSRSPPQPTETQPAPPAATETSAKFSEAKPETPASNPPDQHAQEVREKRVRGAYARRKHKRGGERCVQVCLEKWGKEKIEDLDDQALKTLLDALDKLPEAGEGHGGGGGW